MGVDAEDDELSGSLVSVREVFKVAWLGIGGVHRSHAALANDARRLDLFASASSTISYNIGKTRPRKYVRFFFMKTSFRKQFQKVSKAPFCFRLGPKKERHYLRRVFEKFSL